MAHSILDVARELIDSPEAKTAYADDPDGFIAARGLDGLSNADLQEAVGFVADAMPAPVARQLVAPPGPVTDSLPLARVAAATSMEVAVLEAEPGTVDVTALVDPSGQLDLPTDIGVADAGSDLVSAPDEGGEDVLGVDEEAGDELPAMAADADRTLNDGGFGTGAGEDVGESSADSGEPDEPNEPDNETLDPGLDDGDLATHEPDFGLDDATDAPLGSATGAPGKDEDPPEDDFEDIIV